MLKKLSKLSKGSVLLSSAVLAACGGGSGSNNAPVFNVQESISAFEEQEFVFAIDATDRDGDILTYSASNLPLWLTLDETTGILTGTPLEEDVGVFDDITVNVSDGRNSVSDEFSIEVIATENITVSGRSSGIVLSNALVTVDVVNSVSDTSGKSTNISATLKSNSDEDIRFITDENGFFEFNLQLIEGEFDGSELLEIRIQGVEEQERLEFVSQIGDIDYILSVAGEENELTIENLTRLSVSPLSTALALEAQDLNSSVISDWDLLQEREMGLILDDVVETANLITLLSTEDTVTEGQETILDVLRSGENILQERISDLLDLNNLTDENGNLLEFAADRLNEIEELPNNQIFLNDENIQLIIDRPLVLANPFVQGFHPGILEDVIEFNGTETGTFYRNTLNRNSMASFSWNINEDGVLVINSTPEQRFTDLFSMQVRDLLGVGFSDEINRILSQQNFAQLIPINVTEETIEIRVISFNELSFIASVQHEISYDINETLMDLGFEGELPTVTQNGVLTGDRLVLSNSNLAFETADFEAQSWSLPVQNNFRELLGGGFGESPSQDLYRFFDDGTTGPGLLGGPASVWEVDNGNLIFSTDADSFEITPLIETQDDIYILVERSNVDTGVTKLVSNMTRLIEDNVNQFGQDFILPAPTESSAPIWFSGANFFSNPDDFTTEGVINFELLFGYAFPDGVENIVTRISSDFNFPECLSNDNTSCIERIDERTINVEGNNITIGLREEDTDENFSFFTRRDRVWDVLNYDIDNGRVVVLERILVESRSNLGPVLIAPRINVLQLRDIAVDYPIEYRDNPQLF
ncbi:putative Ig domain-containing protein [Sessilibacter corallicola]|uniref:Dystroglycan-type cadherin-like domain-containing protein n=1 Tax=Sessilibacter corallicola TaxID=2904075 RepID=A0ABQ0ABA4_9GAMM